MYLTSASAKKRVVGDDEESEVERKTAKEKGREGEDSKNEVCVTASTKKSLTKKSLSSRRIVLDEDDPLPTLSPKKKLFELQTSSLPYHTTTLYELALSGTPWTFVQSLSHCSAIALLVHHHFIPAVPPHPSASQTKCVSTRHFHKTGPQPKRALLYGPPDRKFIRIGESRFVFPRRRQQTSRQSKPQTHPSVLPSSLHPFYIPTSPKKQVACDVRACAICRAAKIGFVGVEDG
ncbi:hypothetical protein P691DRAFT_763710 [Macrolepiota fuliginosa MF-IS2]|uniref:Uncharacterized protein n=1 Tax=Macrolepiota fuliginosa MF-IS2 TaxID=1400762 RepID=A0A9P5X3V3_9AGAR|nr:hypothetical protein P691DRAFT_763710 [Macrolepiota fuliginosa MF-IS2]